MSNSLNEIYVSYPGLIIKILFFILYPLVLSFIWCKKFEGKIIPILVGAAGFFVSYSDITKIHYLLFELFI